jgi:hypothetical protein
MGEGTACLSNQGIAYRTQRACLLKLVGLLFGFEACVSQLSITITK